MSFNNVAIICLTVFLCLMLIIFPAYYSDRNTMLAASKDPMMLACAMDAEMTHTSPACSTYIARIKL